MAVLGVRVCGTCVCVCVCVVVVVVVGGFLGGDLHNGNHLDTSTTVTQPLPHQSN